MDIQTCLQTCNKVIHLQLKYGHVLIKHSVSIRISINNITKICIEYECHELVVYFQIFLFGIYFHESYQITIPVAFS